jgi:uncharacterized protein YjdB
LRPAITPQEFGFVSPQAAGTIDQEAKTISVTVPHNTDLSALAPAITHTGVSISPASGEARNFSSPVRYTVTAEDGSEAVYTVTVTPAPNTAGTITAFSFESPAAPGTNNGTDISVTVPYNTDVSALVPVIIHTGTGIVPASGEAQDFSGPVQYTVTAEDGSETVYTVTVTPAASDAREITSFSFASPQAEGTIEGLNISVTVPHSTDVSALVPTITHTGAGIVPASGEAQDFSGPVQYTVTAADGNEAVYTVTVGFSVAVDGVSLDRETLSLTVGEDSILTATISPGNAADKAVTWTSSDTSVATVDGNGKVSGVAPGTATVTVTTEDGGKTAVCAVTVTPVAVDGVTLDRETLTLGVGADSVLAATVSPANATNKAVTWTSSDTGVATVDTNGKVSGVALGTATITVSTVEGGKTDTCAVTVAVTSIAEVQTYLAAASGGVSAADPVSLPVAISLASDWSNLLSAIQTGGKYVALDLSACAMTGTEFDPDNTVNTGKDKIVSLVFPAAAKTIKAGTSGNSTFENFTALAAVAGAEVTGVGDYAFYRYDNSSSNIALKTVDLPAAVSIGDYAFRWCFALETVDLPAAETIGEEAFEECIALTSVSLSASLTSVEGNPFRGCTSLNSITVASGNPAYKHSADGKMLLSKDGKTLIAYSAASGTVTLDSITAVGDYAFFGCNALGTLNLPAAETIGVMAFYNTDGQALEITLGDTAPALGEGIFYGVNTKSVTVKVPSGATGYGSSPANTTDDNWGNGFRGGGWNGSAMTNSSYVNSNITLSINYIP